MAGVIPYVATSLSTVYCAWEINHAASTGAGFLMSEKTAELALHVIEPLQIGYGATVSHTHYHLKLPNNTTNDYTLRSSPSSAPSTGVSNSRASAATTATHATTSASSRPRSPGPRS